MVITIAKTRNEQLLVTSNSTKFTDKYDSVVLVIPKTNLFEVMTELADWSNNELNEECIFEVE